MTLLVYLHGLTDGPEDLKWDYCRSWAESRNIPFAAPDLNVPSLEAITITAQVALVERFILELEAPAVFVGASLGALVAVAAAQRIENHLRSKLKSLILLAPAFGFARRRLNSIPAVQRQNSIVWSSALSRWVRLGPQLFEDLPGWADDDTWTVETPTYVVHGSRDKVVPKLEVEAFVARNPNVRLFVVDDDHKLSAPSTLEALGRILTKSGVG